MTGETAESAISAAHLHRSALLDRVPGVVHGVTKRVPGAGLADGNVGYSTPRDRADAWAMRQQWLSAAGLEAAAIAVAYQAHGREVAIVTASDAGRGADPESRPVGLADALVTAQPGVVLMTLHADCMPILLCDPVRRVVATVHAGWRGTTLDVAGATVQTMVDRFGCDPQDLIAHLGPAIGGCCYEVGADVAAAWLTLEPDDDEALLASGDRWLFDLSVANRRRLERNGIAGSRIEASGICTKCDGEEWFSHRSQGPHTGRYASFIAVTE